MRTILKIALAGMTGLMVANAGAMTVAPPLHGAASSNILLAAAGCPAGQRPGAGPGGCVSDTYVHHHQCPPGTVYKRRPSSRSGYTCKPPHP
jgi:hypothetical protein